MRYSIHVVLFVFSGLAGVVSNAWADQVGAGSATDYIGTVRAFADSVLQYGRDVYGPKHTPLFVDGVNVDTHEPAIWELPADLAQQWKMPRRWIMCDVASQQDFYRTLVALTTLTGDPKYKQAAVDSLRYAFANLRHPSGLLYWGGHAAWDLDTDQPVGEGRTDGVTGKHEFKRNYPFYELMWEVDPQATRSFIESFWSNHILDWSNLDFNRHGTFEPIIANLWDQAYVGGPVPFIGKGLTFIHSASDLYYAAAKLSVFDHNPKPMIWAKRLAQRYHDACDPGTGLGADNFSEEKTRRFVRQFGERFGDRLTEATVTSIYRCRYRYVAVCQLQLGEQLGVEGEEFIRWAVHDLTAYAKHAYDPSDGKFRVTLIDGTRLSPADIKVKGYVTERWLKKQEAEPTTFWAYAMAYRLTGDRLMWEMARNLARTFELGDIGAAPGSGARLNLETPAADAHLLFGILELASKDRSFLDLARKVGDNLVAKEFHRGFFVRSPDHLYSQLNTPTLLALLYLDVALRDSKVRLPSYCGGKGFFHCTFEGAGRTYDHIVIYERLRK